MKITKLLFFVTAIAVFITAIAVPAFTASDWRSFGKVCNYNKRCMRQQAADETTFKTTGYDRDLMKICSDQFVSMYEADYTGALECVDAKQLSRNQKKIQESIVNDSAAYQEFLKQRDQGRRQ